MLTRRQFLFGPNSGPTSFAGPLLPVFGTTCLPRHGIVCRSCAEACRVGAIRFRPALGGVSLPDASADDCTGCGECLPICPVSALRLTLAEELPT